MIIGTEFRLVHNREAALRQEFELARQEYDQALALPCTRPENAARFQAARARLNRARGMLVYG